MNQMHVKLLAPDAESACADAAHASMNAGSFALRQGHGLKQLSLRFNYPHGAWCLPGTNSSKLAVVRVTECLKKECALYCLRIALVHKGKCQEPLESEAIGL